jgi:hypothetical protein
MFAAIGNFTTRGADDQTDRGKSSRGKFHRVPASLWPSEESSEENEAEPAERKELRANERSEGLEKSTAD